MPTPPTGTRRAGLRGTLWAWSRLRDGDWIGLGFSLARQDIAGL